MNKKIDKDFYISELITTFRNINNRLNKDLIITFALFIFVFLYKENVFEFTNLKIQYNSKSAALFAIFSFVLYLSISHHLYKVFLILKELDVKIKESYEPLLLNRDPRVAWAIDLVARSKYKVPFALGDNFFIDFVVTGPTRFPKVSRVLFLQIILFVLFSTFSFYNLLYCFNGSLSFLLTIFGKDLTIFSLLALIILLYFVSFSYLFRFHFFRKALLDIRFNSLIDKYELTIYLASILDRLSQIISYGDLLQSDILNKDSSNISKAKEVLPIIEQLLRSYDSSKKYKEVAYDHYIFNSRNTLLNLHDVPDIETMLSRYSKIIVAVFNSDEVCRKVYSFIYYCGEVVRFNDITARKIYNAKDNLKRLLDLENSAFDQFNSYFRPYYTFQKSDKFTKYIFDKL